MRSGDGFAKSRLGAGGDWLRLGFPIPLLSLFFPRRFVHFDGEDFGGAIAG